MTDNLYCSSCLRTQAFIAMESGYHCPVCRKILLITDPPATQIEIRQQDLPQAQAG